MGILPDDVAADICSVCAEWNDAEKAIKIAEQINGEIINPAIYELRYAGRRIIEALTLINDGNLVKAKSILGDAQFDCCRARHDAIDAVTTKIASDLDVAREKLGAGSVLQAFPDFSSLVGSLYEVRDKIVESRENRENRNAIYESIQNGNLTQIVKKYKEFQASEPIMKQYAQSERRNKIFFVRTTVASVLIALAALIYSITSR